MPLRDQCPVDPGQRHDIAHRAERDEIEPLQEIGLGPAAIPAGLAQRAVERDDQQKGDPDRGERAVRARLVEPVRIDHGERARQQRLRDVMIDDDHVEPGLGRGRQRVMRGRAAIHRHDDRRPLGLEAQQRRRVRPIAFAQPVGDIDRGIAADRRKKAQQQGRRGRAVDIVIAEHDDPLAARGSRARGARPPAPCRADAPGRAADRAGAARESRAPRRAPMPRCANSRATISGNPSRSAIAAAAPSSAARTRQRRPQTERSTPRKAGG